MYQLEPSAAAARAAAQRRTMRRAWIALVGFFLLFTALLTWAGVAAYSFVRDAADTRAAILIVRGPLEGLSWQPAGRTIFQGVAEEQILNEGDAVRAVASAGYGQVASLRLFEASQFDLWAGAELRLDTLRTSRWNDRLLDVRVRQSGGYVRYDLKSAQPYDQVRFVVDLGVAELLLDPGGSYSVSLQTPSRSMILLNTTSAPLLKADVAVRRGRATVLSSNGQRMILPAGTRMEIDPAGLSGLAIPARWELIRDGDFNLFSEEEYNNTTLEVTPTRPRADSWQVSGQPTLPVEQRGYFRLSQVCRPPTVESYCALADRRIAAWFYRTGDQTNGFATSIRQRLGPDRVGVDISEYRELTFSLWARVLNQSLDDAGDRGSECPVMVRIVARRSSPADPDDERVICMYVDSQDQAPRVRSDQVAYYPVAMGEWFKLTIDLRDKDWLPEYRYLRSIEIYANGHDYDSRVSEISLIGEQ